MFSIPHIPVESECEWNHTHIHACKMPALFQDILGDMFPAILICHCVKVDSFWNGMHYSKVRWLDRWTGYFPRVSSQLFIALCNFDLNWWSRCQTYSYPSVTTNTNHTQRKHMAFLYGLFGYLYISFLSEKLRPKIISEWVWKVYTEYPEYFKEITEHSILGDWWTEL